MTQISHDAGQLRKPDGVWQVNVAKRVFAAIDSYAWWQVIHWIRSKHHRITWKQLRRRFTAPSGRIAADGLVLSGASKIKIRRYRYRGHKIPAPWITQAVTPVTSPRRKLVRRRSLPTSFPDAVTWRASYGSTVHGGVGVTVVTPAP